MNAAWHGTRNLGPRAHPNDGKLDLTIGGVPPSQRRSASERALTGTHVPHPDLRTFQTAEFETEIPNLMVYLDGVPHGRARELRVTLEPDAGVVVL
jgi:diacylglycerol kinase (ATP)